MDLICTVPTPHLLGPATWARRLSPFLVYILRNLSKSAGFVSLAGEALSLLYLMLPYFYDPSMFIYRFIRISWKKVCWKGSMAAEMSSRASYLVYYIVWRVIKQIITKIRLSIKDTNN